MKRIISILGALMVTACLALADDNWAKTVMYDSKTFKFLESNLIASNSLVTTTATNSFMGTQTFFAINLGGVTLTSWPLSGGDVYLGSNQIFTATNTFGDLIGGRSVWGSGGLSPTNMSASSYGANQRGYLSNGGRMKILTQAYGASQNGQVDTGMMSITNNAIGASQWGYVGLMAGGMGGGARMLVGSSVGAMQRGISYGYMTIGDSAHAASQAGFSEEITATATNNGIAAMQLFHLTTGQRALTTSGGEASILLGAGISSNKNAIVAGDSQVSHGDGSVSASGGFWDNGVRILPTTNYVTGFNIDAGDTTISTNSKGYFRVPTTGTIVQWVMRADNASTVVVSIAKCSAEDFPITTSIIASAPMTLDNQKCVTNSTLTGWTKGLTAGDYLKYIVLTNSSATNLAIELKVSVP